MKIFHAAETIRGGVATVMRHNISAQTRMFGADNVLALIPRDQASDLQQAMPFKSHFFERSGRNLISYFSFLKNFSQVALKEKPDIIHLHSSFAAFFGRIAIAVLYPFAKSRPGIVYCPHAFGFLMQCSDWKKRMYALAERLLLPLTDAVICVSKFEKNRAVDFGIPAGKLNVVYNGVPIPDPTPIKREDGEDNTIHLLFIGRFDYQKGYDLLLQLMKRLEGKPFHLTIVGGAMHSNETPQPRPNITYAGWMSPDDIRDYISACDLLVMPSRWEGFAMVPLEAMANGRPVLASDFGSIAELVIEGKTGRIFPVGHVPEMQRILQSTSKNDWAEMGKTAAECVKNKFSVEKMTKETLSLYSNVLELKAKA